MPASSGIYGMVDNRGGTEPESGHCVLSGATEVKVPIPKWSFWAASDNGSAGAELNCGSMTETPVGHITLSSQFLIASRPASGRRAAGGTPSHLSDALHRRVPVDAETGPANLVPLSVREERAD